MAKRPTGRRGTLIQQSRQVSSEEKAIQHNLTAKVRRPFFDLGRAGQQHCLDQLERLVDQRLKRQGAS